ncbi:MAG: helix-turn-helix domain-containing protein [bacterium]|nr:helix-turn-helix domain-containing protein [bacterium]
MSQLARFLRERLKEIPLGEVGKKADLAGISREQMTRWRRGRLPVNPTLATLERLAEVLDLRIGVSEIETGEVVAEAGAEYQGAAGELRRELEQEQQRLRNRIKRLESELGIEVEPDSPTGS